MNKTVAIKIGIVILELVLIYNFGIVIGETKKYKDISSLVNGTYTDFTISIYDRTSAMVDTFMQYISTQKYEEAFALLDDNCKITQFNNQVSNFENTIKSKCFDPVKGKKEYDITMNQKKSIYMSDDLHAFYEVYMYSPDTYNMQTANTINPDDPYYYDRDLLIDVIDTQPYEFKISMTMKDY